MSVDYSNTGSLNPAKDKRSEKSPDWWGKLSLSGDVLEAIRQGKPVRISGWNRDGKYGEFISLKVSVEQETNRNAQPSEAGALPPDAGAHDQKPWPSTGPGHKKAHAKPGTIEGNLALKALKGMDHPDEQFDDDIPF